MASTSQSIVSFMKSSLVSWVKTIHTGSGNGVDYKLLCDGSFLHDVWLQIDPKPSQNGLLPSGNSEDIVVRIKNLNILIANIKIFYEEILGQLLIMQPPDVIKLGKHPEDEGSVEEMSTLLLLILGSAVQCERKQFFIENIKSLDLDSQHTIVESIQKITESPEYIWSLSWQDLCNLPKEDQEHLFSVLLQNLKTLINQRDELNQRLISVVMDQEIGALQMNSSIVYPDHFLLSPTTSNSPDRPHLIVELADVKSRLRKLQQENEEKNELMAELKEEMENRKEHTNRLRQENLELIQDARTAKAYRDEVDILKERVHKVDRLETEIQRYKDKMNELEFYRSRVEELREDNRILTDTKVMLEEQLDSCRKRGEQIAELEADILKYQSKSSEMLLIQESYKDKVQLLLEENSQLHFEKKVHLEEFARLQNELTHLRSQNSPVNELNLQDQINMDAQTRVLHLEFENSKLRSERDNQLLTPLLEEKNQLEDRLHKMEALEIQVQDAKVEQEQSAERIACLEAKRQELDNTVNALESQIKTLRANETKLQSTEQNLASLTTENQRVHRLVESLQGKLHSAQQESLSLENENLKLNSTLESLKLSVRKFHELEKENTNLEAENHKLEQEKKYSEKENKRLKNSVEIKDSTIEDLSSRVSGLERENKQLSKEKENLKHVSVRMREQEKENRELVQQVTLANRNLSVLRQDLVSEKIKNQNLKGEVERISLLLEQTSREKELANERSIPEEMIVMADEHGTENQLESSLQCSSNSFEQSQASNIIGMKDAEIHQPKEIFTLKNIITDLERKLVLLDEDNQNLRNQASTLKDQNAALNSQVEAFQQRLVSVNKQNGETHSKLAKLEVEATLLKSQNCSITSQNTNYQAQVSSLEDRGKLLQNSIGELQDIQKSLLDDHEALQKLHNQLTLDYENLNYNHTTLKAQHRNLKTEHGILMDKLQATAISQEEVARLREVLDESPKLDRKNLHSLRIQHAQLKEHIKTLKEEKEKIHIEYKSLLETKKALKTENNELKLKHTKLQGELAESRDHMATLDVEVSRLSNYCETLSQANTTLSDEHTSLMQHVTNLLSEYHSLLAKYIEEQEDNMQGGNYLMEKLKDLTWQRNKLEQKFSERAQQNAKLFRRPRYHTTTAQSMRRTKSQQLSSSRSNDFSQELLEKEISFIRNVDRRSYHNGFSESDEIPVRDVGPLAAQDTNANLNQDLHRVSASGQPSSAPLANTSLPSIPHSTTVENYTTVNFITHHNQEAQPSSRESPTPATSSNSPSSFSPSPFLRQPSNRPRSAILCNASDGSSTPVFGSIMPRNGLRSSRNYGKNNGQTSLSSSPQTNLNCSLVEEAGACNSPDSNGGERSRPLSTGGTPANAKGKSAIWYEYGCV